MAATLHCPVCGKWKPASKMIAGTLLPASVVELIRLDHPDWTVNDQICLEDLHRYRMKFVRHALESEKGEVSELDQQVLASMEQNEVLSKNVDVVFEEHLTYGQRMADRIASFGGSWKFIGIFAVVLLSWIAINTITLLVHPFDPYPFILLNLVLSCIAAIQAPVIMMSQNRQEAKDRIRAEHDYQVNLKAELEIRMLNDKVDHLLLHQWTRLLEIQEIQIDMLEELSGRAAK
jgi:uncharacterized membrane protein